MLQRIAHALLGSYIAHFDRRLDELRAQLERVEHAQKEWIRDLGTWAHEEGTRTRAIAESCMEIRRENAACMLTMLEASAHLERSAARCAAENTASQESALLPFVFASLGHRIATMRIAAIGSPPALAQALATAAADVATFTSIAALPAGTSAAGFDAVCWLDGSAGRDGLAALTEALKPGGFAIVSRHSPDGPAPTAGWQLAATALFQRTDDGGWRRTDTSAHAALSAVCAVRQG